LARNLAGKHLGGCGGSLAGLARPDRDPIRRLAERPLDCGADAQFYHTVGQGL